MRVQLRAEGRAKGYTQVLGHSEQRVRGPKLPGADECATSNISSLICFTSTIDSSVR